MTVKFGKFERVAGLFVLVAIVGTITSTFLVAVEQGWFAKKYELKTTFSTGEGLHVGTIVQIAGLRAGSVSKVVLETDDKVTVVFQVQEEFYNRIKKDSVVQVVRPFVIGEKVIDIKVGSKDGEPIHPGYELTSRPSTDIMDLISGRELGQYLETMRSMAENLRFLAESLFSQSRSKAIIEVFDQLPSTVKNLNLMTVEVTQLSKMLTERKQIGVVLKNVADLTNELNKITPDLFAKTPKLTGELVSTLENLNRITAELQLVLPALREIAPDLPKTSRRTVEAIDELVVTLKALQKNFMLRGKVEEVREEEKKRVPAGN